MTLHLTGIHHLKFPVSDLAAGVRWFTDVMGATRVPRFDHRDTDGELYGVILMLPGLREPVELRLAPAAAKAVAGYDPVTFGVANRAALDDWVAHFDAHGITHSPVIHGYIGDLVEIETPEGLPLRLYTDPVGGFDSTEFSSERADRDTPHLNRRGLMEHRGPAEAQ